MHRLDTKPRLLNENSTKLNNLKNVDFVREYFSYKYAVHCNVLSSVTSEGHTCHTIYYVIFIHFMIT